MNSNDTHIRHSQTHGKHQAININAKINFVLEYNISSKAFLIRVMYWCQSDGKLSPVPIVTNNSVASLGHSGLILLNHFDKIAVTFIKIYRSCCKVILYFPSLLAFHLYLLTINSPVQFHGVVLQFQPAQNGHLVTNRCNRFYYSYVCYCGILFVDFLIFIVQVTSTSRINIRTALVSCLR